MAEDSYCRSQSGSKREINSRESCRLWHKREFDGGFLWVPYVNKRNKGPDDNEPKKLQTNKPFLIFTQKLRENRFKYVTRLTRLIET